MPADLEQLHSAIRRFGQDVVSRLGTLERAQQRALDLLRAAASQPQALRASLSVALAANPNLRCAAPATEDIAVGFWCAEAPPPEMILAVDGSQVLPDRHQELLFGLVNVGSVLLRPGSASSPQIRVDTKLLVGGDLETERGGPLSEGDLALLRDAAERTALLSHAPDVDGPSIALTDGPLELWGAKDVSDPGAYERALGEYLTNLRELQRRGWILAGFVDKPAADLVVKLLEIHQGSPNSGAERISRPLHGVTDRWLFGQILEPEQRSAIFFLQSASSRRYTESLALHFFYLNLGSVSRPVIARVEIPQWVAENPDHVHTLHAALIAQSALLGASPYPYILHRAHETARVSRGEADEIKLRLLLEMRRLGSEPDIVSSKSSAKAVSGDGRSY